MRIVYYLIMVCVTNAWLLYKEINNSNIILRKFIAEIANSLMHSGKTVKRGRPKIEENQQTAKKSKKPNQTRVTLDIRFDSIDHFMIYSEKRGTC